MKKYSPNEYDLDLFIDLFDELPLWSAPFGIKMLDHINYRPGITALDIGFGNGFPLTEIAMRLGESAVVYGIDPWKKAIERVLRKIEFYGIANIKIIEGLAESIPLEDNSIDLITSNNGINNVSDIYKVLSECSRIARKNSQFIQTMNLDKSMNEFYEVFEDVLNDMKMIGEVELMHNHIAHKRPPIDRIISAMQKNGFTIKDLEHDCFYYRFVNGTAFLNHYFIRLAFMGSWMEILPPDKALSVFREIEIRLNRLAEKDGLMITIPFILINAIKY